MISRNFNFNVVDGMYSLIHSDDVSDHHSQILRVKKTRLSGSLFLSEETTWPLQELISKDFSKHKHGLLLIHWGWRWRFDPVLFLPSSNCVTD